MPWETEQRAGKPSSRGLLLKSNIERTYTSLKSSCVPHRTDRLLLLMSKLSLNKRPGFQLFDEQLTSAAPGSAQGLLLIGSDIEAPRDELVTRGINATRPLAASKHRRRDKHESGPRAPLEQRRSSSSRYDFRTDRGGSSAQAGWRLHGKKAWHSSLAVIIFARAPGKISHSRCRQHIPQWFGRKKTCLNLRHSGWP